MKNKIDLSALKNAMKNKKYLNVQDYIEDDPELIYYLFVQPVNVGKTWSAIALAIIKFVEEGKTTIWIRRNQTAVKRAFGITFFNFHKQFLKGVDFSFKTTSDGVIFYLNGEPFIYAHALSSILSHGTESPSRVWAIVYDEFMPAISAGERSLPNETFLFKHAYKSFSRDPDPTLNLRAICLFLGNAHSKFSQYFSWLGVDYNGKNARGKHYKLITDLPEITSENADSPFMKSAGKDYRAFATENNAYFGDRFLVQNVKNLTPIFNLKMGDIRLGIARTASTYAITPPNQSVITYGISISEKGMLPPLDLIYNNPEFQRFRLYAVFNRVIISKRELLNDFQSLLMSGLI